MGRNLVKFLKFDDVSLIRKYDAIFVIFMSQQLKKWKSSSFLCFWIDEAKI